MADFYEILGVGAGATAAEVRQAYLRLAKERHPDRFTDPEEKAKAQDFFKDLTAAFNTLSNDKNRQQYDAERAKPKLTAPAEIAQDAYERAFEHLEARDFHEAVTLFRTAVLHAPDDPRYRAGLSKALSQNPHWIREAIEEIERAIQIAPRHGPFHAQLALLLHGQGLKLRARRAAENAVRLAPQDREVQRVAALCEAGAG